MSHPIFRRRSQLPYFLELIASLVARTLYRVRSSGAENIPVTGGVLLIANHISYVDVIVLQLTCPRPIRFVGHQGLKRNPFSIGASKSAVPFRSLLSCPVRA